MYSFQCVFVLSAFLSVCAVPARHIVDEKPAVETSVDAVVEGVLGGINVVVSETVKDVAVVADKVSDAAEEENDDVESGSGEDEPDKPKPQYNPEELEEEVEEEEEENDRKKRDAHTEAGAVETASASDSAALDVYGTELSAEGKTAIRQKMIKLYKTVIANSATLTAVNERLDNIAELIRTRCTED